MSVLDKIKSVLGIGSSESSEGTNVRVEHEPESGPDASTEEAVKGTGTEAGAKADAETAAGAEADAETAAVEEDEEQVEEEEPAGGEPAGEEPAEEETGGAGADAAGSGDVTPREESVEADEAGEELDETTEEPDDTVETGETTEEAGATAEETDESQEVEETREDETRDADGAAGAGSEEPGDGGQPAESVSGIGPAYADRLSDAGVETVSDLLEADPEHLGEETDVSPKRIQRWQERADDL